MPTPIHSPMAGLADRHIQLFRRGTPYASRDLYWKELHSGLLAVGLAPGVMIVHDAKWLKRVLADKPHPLADAADRKAVILKALELLRHATLDIPGLGRQTPEGFATEMRGTCGLPSSLVDRWMDLLYVTFAEEAPQAGWADGLEVVSLPANTFVCLSAVLKALMRSGAVWSRPSRQEPFSAARLIAALLEAGWPTDRLGFYPTGHGALKDLLDVADRAVVYGGDALPTALLDRPHVSVNLAGHARAFIAQGVPVEIAVDWLTPRIAGEAGRFCNGLGTILCAGNSIRIAEGVADRLDRIELSSVGDSHLPQAFPGRLIDPQAIAGWVVDRLRAEDRLVTRRPLVVDTDTGPTLAPCLVRIRDIEDHPLCGVELPFAFAVIAETSAERFPSLCRGAAFVSVLGRQIFNPAISAAPDARWSFHHA